MQMYQNFKKNINKLSDPLQHVKKPLLIGAALIFSFYSVLAYPEIADPAFTKQIRLFSILIINRYTKVHPVSRPLIKNNSILWIIPPFFELIAGSVTRFKNGAATSPAFKVSRLTSNKS